ncbi:uroporphyrinogen decarboxylase family protein [Chloroflexota bacterium]
MRHASPDFERVRTALLLQGEPDRVPLVELEVHSQIKRAFLGRSPEGPADEVEFWVRAGYDFIPQQVGMVTMLFRESRKRGNIFRAGKAQYSVLEQGENFKLWAQEGKGVITTMEEFEAFDWPTAQSFDYSILQELASHMPQGMKVVPYTVGYFLPVYFLMGAETLFMSLYENPDLVERLFQKVGSIEYAVLEKVLEYECVGAVWITDDIAYSDNLLVSPKHLRKYVFPRFKRAVDLCKRKGRPVIYHSDGKLYDVIGDLIDCGFNALHPIEPKAMDIAYLKKTIGDKLCLMGNIDLAYTLTLGTPEEVADETRQRLREIAPGGGYCVSSSNSVTEYVPIENYNAMRETVLRHGSYPISIGT